MIWLVNVHLVIKRANSELLKTNEHTYFISGLFGNYS